MIYVQYVLFGILTAVAIALFLLAIWQKRLKAFIAANMLGFLFLSLAGMVWPHQVIVH